MNRLGAALCAAAFSLGTAAAGPIVIQNPGFKTATLPYGIYEGAMSNVFTNPSSTPGWTGIEPNNGSAFGGAYHTTLIGDPVTWTFKGWSGQNMGYLQPFPATNIMLRQVLTDTLQNDTTYDLSVLIGRRVYDWGGPNFVYDVQLLAGGNALASGNPLALATNSFATHSLSYNSGSANPFAGLALEIRLVAPAGNEVFFDDVTLNATSTPEPASAVIAAIGVGLLAAGRRRSA